MMMIQSPSTDLWIQFCDQFSCRHRQGPINIYNGVIGSSLSGQTDRIAPHRTVGLRGRRPNQGSRNQVGVFIVDESRVAHREQRIGRSIRTALVIGRAGQERRRHAQGPILPAHRVIACLATRIDQAGHNRVAPHRTALARRRAEA